MIGVHADTKDACGRKPLSYAAEAGNADILKLMLGASTDVDSRENSGRTPLSWAAAKGHEATANLLLGTSKVDIKTKDNQGQAPVSLAVQNGRGGIAKLLLEAEAKSSRSQNLTLGHGAAGLPNTATTSSISGNEHLQVNIYELLEFRRMQKSNPRNTRPQDLMSKLASEIYLRVQERHYLFFFDNSPSLFRYRKEVERSFEGLSPSTPIPIAFYTKNSDFQVFLTLSKISIII
jgi:hypothetical protein